MANTGKARRTGIIRTEKRDGVVSSSTKYTMLTPAPFGCVIPSGWSAVTAAQVKSWTGMQYSDAMRSFLAILGIPVAERDALLGGAEYTESACLLISEEGPAITMLEEETFHYNTYCLVKWRIQASYAPPQSLYVPMDYYDVNGQVKSTAITLGFGTTEAEVYVHYDKLVGGGEQIVNAYLLPPVAGANYRLGTPSTGNAALSAYGTSTPPVINPA